MVVLITLILAGCNSSSDSVSSSDTNTENNNAKIYYGDIKNNRIAVINTTTMELEKFIEGTGEYPYEVSKLDANRIVAIDRKDYKVDVIENDSITNSVSLDFKPRSFKTNSGNILFSSVSEPSELLFNSDFSSSSKYGDSTYTVPSSYGGSYATGHPYWVNENYFILLDRCENAIELYKKGRSTPISKVITASSVHHIIYRDGIYYGMMEGSDTKAPGVIKFSVKYEKIETIDEKYLSDFSEDNISIMGGHHLAMHPSNNYLYVPSREGVVYVLNASTLALVDKLETGKGVGHIIFANVGDKVYMITTNHHDNYKSIFDATDPTDNIKLKDIALGDAPAADGMTTQSHTTHILDHKLYFTYNDANNSYFEELDLDTLTITRKLKLSNSYLLMGTLNKDIGEDIDM